MNEPTHTKTPWYIDASQEEGIRIIADTGVIIARFPGAYSNPEVYADAAFVLKATNNYQNLLAIVQRVADGEWSDEGHQALRRAAITALPEGAA